MANYDFANLWQSRVHPHLEEPLVAQAICDGVTAWLSRTYGAQNPICYDDTLPASFYGDSDYWNRVLTRETGFEAWYEEREHPAFLQWAQDNPDEYCAHLSIIQETVEDCPHCGLLGDAYSTYLKSIFLWTDTIVPDAKQRWMDGLREFYALTRGNSAWYVIHNSFVWNPTFSLALARAVEPQQQWELLRYNGYCTVMNRARSLAFDPLHWYFNKRQSPERQFRRIVHNLDRPGASQSKHQFYKSGNFCEPERVARKILRRVDTKLDRLEAEGRLAPQLGSPSFMDVDREPTGTEDTE